MVLSNLELKDSIEDNVMFNTTFWKNLKMK